MCGITSKQHQLSSDHSCHNHPWIPVIVTILNVITQRENNARKYDKWNNITMIVLLFLMGFDVSKLE